MTARLRARARRERATRNVGYAVRELARSWTFPFRRPGMWLLCKYLNVFFRLYYSGRVDAAFRFARLWPSQMPALVDGLRRSDRYVPAVLL